jgi:hypothetical protein
MNLAKVSRPTSVDESWVHVAFVRPSVTNLAKVSRPTSVAPEISDMYCNCGATVASDQNYVLSSARN